MVDLLAAVLADGLVAVEAACAEALLAGAYSRDVILNILTRLRQPEPTGAIMTPNALRLRAPPIADCSLYDALRRKDGTPEHSRPDGNAEALRHAVGL